MLRPAVCLSAVALLVTPAAGQVGGPTGASRSGAGLGSLSGGGFGAGSTAGSGAGATAGTSLGAAAGIAGPGGRTGTGLGFGEGLRPQDPGLFLGSGAGLNPFIGGAGGQQALDALGGLGTGRFGSGGIGTGGFGTGGFGTGGFGSGGLFGGAGAAGPVRRGGNRAAGNDPRLNIAVPLRLRVPRPAVSAASLSQTLARRAAVLSAATRFAPRPGFRGLRTAADDAGTVTLSGDLPEADRRLAVALARIEPGVRAVREEFGVSLPPSPTPAPAPPAADAPVLLRTDAVTPLRVLNP